MSRAVYIGGFGNGNEHVNRVADALADGYYDRVDGFSFGFAMENPGTIRRAVIGAVAVTHSAGMLAIKGTAPSMITAFNAPLPRTRAQLIGGTVAKTIAIRSATGDTREALWHGISSVAELLTHTSANLGQVGKISQFNAVEAALAARREAGIQTTLVYTLGDEYYRLSEPEIALLLREDVGVALIPGVHDSLVLEPAGTLIQLWQPQIR